jgi:hypothetical protein
MFIRETARANDFRVGPGFADKSNYFMTIHYGHLQIGDYQIDRIRRGSEKGDSFNSIGCCKYLMPMRLKRPRSDRTDWLFIIRNEHDAHFSALSEAAH